MHYEWGFETWEIFTVIKTAIVNVVVTVALDQELNLDELGKFKEILHDSDIYGGRVAYFKTSEMQGRVSIFASGKMISVGTTSEEEAFCELEYAKDFLVNRDFIKPTVLHPRIRNIVVTADLGDRIDLEGLSKTYRAIYEPEQFPGVILKIEEPGKATVLIFASGKAIIAGLKSSEQIITTIQRLMEIITMGNRSRQAGLGSPPESTSLKGKRNILTSRGKD